MVGGGASNNFSDGRDRERNRYRDNDRPRSDVKSRLGEHTRLDDERPSIRDRLGDRHNNDWDDRDRPMDRDELESRRPMTKPWDVNPEFVPKGFSYYEVVII